MVVIFSPLFLYAICLQFAVGAESGGIERTASVIVVGAGVAGLMTAYSLREAGVDDLLILEASQRIGGRLRKESDFTDYPIDLGASFVGLQDFIVKTAGAQVRLAQPFSYPFFSGSTYYDFFNDYIASKVRDRTILGCVVDRVDITKKGADVTCGERRFFANFVVVTVPLSVIKDGDIAFSPPLPNRITQHPGEMWPGFKFFIEFSKKFYPNHAFCLDAADSRQCEDDTGESLIFDYTLTQDSKTQVLSGFFVGDRYLPFAKMSDDEKMEKLLSLLDKRFNGSATRYYRKHFLMDWTNEPFIRGVYSSRGAETLGAQNIDNTLFIAGEAFPAKSENEHGWVDGAFTSGLDAAEQILKIRKQQVLEGKE